MIHHPYSSDADASEHLAAACDRLREAGKKLRAAWREVRAWLSAVVFATGILCILCSLVCASAKAEVVASTDWEPCVYFDKGDLPDGRRVWRTLQTDRRADDGTCPARDDCVWADIDWDGAVGVTDYQKLGVCMGLVYDDAPTPP